MGDDHKERWDRLSEIVAKVMAAKHVPGVAVGILNKGEVSSAGFGVTNVEHPLPITDETLFQIGSITKTYTGTAIMRLVEMGKLDLDVPVRTYLPDFKVVDEAATSEATLRHLLTHTAGWVGDFFDDTGAGDDALSEYVARMADLEQLAPPGTAWSYNNAGFSLAGRIVELVTEKSYEAAVKELVLEPLGLGRSYFAPSDVMTYRFAVGHHGGDEGPVVARPWPLPRSAYPAGGIVCNVLDLLRYAHFHLGDGKPEDGTQLLSAESMAQMQSPLVTVWGKEAWGLSWSVDETHGTRQVSHGGGTNGQVTWLGLYPEHDFAFAILTNADQGGHVTREVGRWIQKEYLGVEIPDPKPIESSEEELARYVGCYSRPFSEIELGMLAGRLVGQVIYTRGFPTKDAPPPPPPPPAALGLFEKDRLLVLDGPLKEAKAEVIRRPDGSIGWLRASGRLHVRQP
jgi:CubicO group peptidase (beta-lactamase class C family)